MTRSQKYAILMTIDDALGGFLLRERPTLFYGST